MPGQRNFFPGHGFQFPGAQIIAGSFSCNGASAPVVINPARNAKFTISAPSTGVYTITLSDGPIAGGLISYWAQLSDPNANSTRRALMANPFTIGSTGAFTLVTQSTAGTDANIADATVIVSFALVLSSSAGVNS